MDGTRYFANSDVLRAVLKKQDRTPAWLARKSGVSEPMMYYILDRKRTASGEVAEAAADALGIPLFLIF